MIDQDWADVNAYAEAKAGVITEIKETRTKFAPLAAQPELPRIALSSWSCAIAAAC